MPSADVPDHGWVEEESLPVVHPPAILSPPQSPANRSEKRKITIDDRVPTTLARVFNESLIEGIRVKFQPIGRGRRSVNRSHFDIASRKINWTLEFVFEADRICYKFLTHDVNEDSTIDDVLRHLVSGTGFAIPDTLSCFRTYGVAHVTLYHVSDTGYVIVTPDVTLKQANMLNRTVLEFPTIAITPKDYGTCIKYVIDAD